MSYLCQWFTNFFFKPTPVWIVCISLFGGSLWAAEPQETEIADNAIIVAEKKRVYVNANVLNVRNQPNLSGKIIGKLRQNSEQKVIARKGQWLKIDSRQYPGEAWISAQFTSSREPQYHDFIRIGALAAYDEQGPQKEIMQQYQKSAAEINKNRRAAADIALASGKCDLVNAVYLDSHQTLEYVVRCQNKAMIKLTHQEVAQRTDPSSVVTEAEKALSRSVARNRCEDRVKQQLAHDASLRIEPYSIWTWITPNGETTVSMTFSTKSSSADWQESVAFCIFRYNDKDSFTITSK